MQTVPFVTEEKLGVVLVLGHALSSDCVGTVERQTIDVRSGKRARPVGQMRMKKRKDGGGG